MRITKTVWSSVGAMVVATAVAGGCGETADPRPDDGSGGSASGGADGSASGGADAQGSGGVDGSASGGKNGEVDCQVLSLGSGGSPYLANCPEWFGQGGEGGEGGAAPLTCSSDEDENGVEPALARACATVGTIYFEQHLVKCLQPLAEEPCASDHEQKVRACFAAKKPCGGEIEECAPLADACPALSPGLCYWGMSEARAAKRDDELAECFADQKDGESCDDTFFRCAWGL